ncbi:MAG: alpha/beta hydrolase [Marinobacter sp.]|uniref:alpha/beta fold hydrolase n=1 Tax=Marinobacter sp. TaxID=50741 RepID=UPI00299D2B7F|nr:alpha/beta hydrolase [Marinobacter sp.]MDX1634816.1 alpha/beta hydrolase [Marinobacter sp.]
MSPASPNASSRPEPDGPARSAIPRRRLNRYLDLADGRRLAYADCGAPDGHPIVFSHGMPGSRLEAGFFHHQARRDGFRILALDRPGIGFSSRQTRHGMGEYADDVELLVDQLGIESFTAMGWSSGGSRSLACARALGRRVERVLLLSSYTHLEEYSLGGRWFLETGWPGQGFLALGMPVFRFVVACVARLARWRSGAYLTQVRKLTSPDDRQLLEDPEHWELFHRDQLVCLHSSGRAIAQDLANELAHWGFELSEVKVPVTVFQGTDDPFTPPDFARHLVESLPHARLEMLPQRGHFYLLDEAFQAGLFAALGRELSRPPDGRSGR